MTKYQRGELMEGWNDCPVPVPTSSSGTSSSTSSAKARKRMSRVPIIGGSNSSESSASSSRSSVMPPIPCSLPVPPKGPAKTTPSEAPTCIPADESGSDSFDAQQSEARLRDLIASAALADREKEFFEKRLVDAFPSLASPHQRFIAQVVDGVAAKAAGGALKTQVLNYMMMNSGVSTWGVPLKKLVETLGK
ncbi:hypothetical protein OXX59_004181 [Metschnikowia pulcherrima]